MSLRPSRPLLRVAGAAILLGVVVAGAGYGVTGRIQTDRAVKEEMRIRSSHSCHPVREALALLDDGRLEEARRKLWQARAAGPFHPAVDAAAHVANGRISGWQAALKRTVTAAAEEHCGRS